MKITFILPTADLSGGVKVVAIYAERLERRGHEVHVLTPPPHVPSLRDRARALVRERRWLRQEGSHLATRQVRHRVVRHRGPFTDDDVQDGDVVIATWWETANWVAHLSPRKGAKVLFIQGYEALDGEDRPDIDATWRLPFQKIVISGWLKEMAETRFGDASAIHIPNGVDFAQFDAPPRNMQARPTLGMLSHSSPLKGTDLAFLAIERIMKAIPNLRIVSFGTEPPSRHLRQPKGFEFHLLPPQSHIRNIYSQCDIWLCSSRREGFHLPPLEAMACRCPVVSTRVGGPADIIKSGVNGYLVDVGDIDGLALNARRVLLSGEASWRRLSDAAYASAQQRGWDDATLSYEQALETAIARASRGEISGGGRVTPHLQRESPS